MLTNVYSFFVVHLWFYLFFGCVVFVLLKNEYLFVFVLVIFYFLILCVCTFDMVCCLVCGMVDCWVLFWEFFWLLLLL